MVIRLTRFHPELKFNQSFSSGDIIFQQLEIVPKLIIFSNIIFGICHWCRTNLLIIIGLWSILKSTWPSLYNVNVTVMCYIILWLLKTQYHSVETHKNHHYYIYKENIRLGLLFQNTKFILLSRTIIILELPWTFGPWEFFCISW